MKEWWNLEYSNIPETIIEITVYNEVHDAVQNEQKVIYGRRTNKPNWRNESITTSNYSVTIEHFVKVQKQSWKVCDNKNADDTNKN